MIFIYNSFEYLAKFSCHKIKGLLRIDMNPIKTMSSIHMFFPKSRYITEHNYVILVLNLILCSLCLTDSTSPGFCRHIFQYVFVCLILNNFNSLKLQELNIFGTLVTASFKDFQNFKTNTTKV